MRNILRFNIFYRIDRILIMNITYIFFQPRKVYKIKNNQFAHCLTNSIDGIKVN